MRHKEVCTTSVSCLIYLHRAVSIFFRNLAASLRLSKPGCSGLCMGVVVGLGPGVQTRLLYEDMSYKPAISSSRFSFGTFNNLETLTALSEQRVAWAWKGWEWWGRVERAVAPFPFQVCLCSCTPARACKHLRRFSYLLPTYTGWDVYSYTAVSSSSTHSCPFWWQATHTGARCVEALHLWLCLSCFKKRRNTISYPCSLTLADFQLCFVFVNLKSLPRRAYRAQTALAWNSETYWVISMLLHALTLQIQPTCYQTENTRGKKSTKVIFL